MLPQGELGGAPEVKNVDEMRKPELMKYAATLGVETRRVGGYRKKHLSPSR